MNGTIASSQERDVLSNPSSPSDDVKAPSSPDHDLEKSIEGSYVKDASSDSISYDGVPRDKGLYKRLWQYAHYLDRFGVESRGIERVPPNERGHTRLADAGLLWFCANLQPTSIALGALGPTVFEMGLIDSALTILFFNLLTTVPTAYFSTFGKSSGLRQMVLGRYSFGPWVVLFPTLLNCLAQVGWSTVNSIVAAQTLHVVTDDHQIPVAAAVVVVAILTLAVAIFGYKVVHTYLHYAWIPVAIIFFIMLGVSVQYMETGYSTQTGSAEAAAVLSFGAAIAGFALGWSSYAADYTVNMPESASDWKLFAWVYAGLNVSMILTETLGAALTTTFTARPDYGDLYTEYSTGGLLRAALEPVGGFGRFCLVILALSIVANNIPNVYSFALSMQTLHPYLQAVPRFIWSIVCTGIYIGLAIAGADSFEETLDTLLVLLAYWLVIYFVIVSEEHLIFRGGKWSNYDLESYNKYSKLPRGIAAAIAICCGAAGAVVGMATQWYVGPIADDISSPFGGDLGFELSFCFAGLVYPPLRYLERRYLKV